MYTIKFVLHIPGRTASGSRLQTASPWELPLLVCDLAQMLVPIRTLVHFSSSEKSKPDADFSTQLQSAIRGQNVFTWISHENSLHMNFIFHVEFTWNFLCEIHGSMWNFPNEIHAIFFTACERSQIQWAISQFHFKFFVWISHEKFFTVITWCSIHMKKFTR